VPAAGATIIEEPSAFADLDFGDEPLGSAAPHIEEAPAPPARAEPKARPAAPQGDAEVPPPVAPEYDGATTAGIAYITVTDAAGRVLFRRAATPHEVSDALRSADTAQAEGEAAMDRISYDRLLSELSGAPGALPPGNPKP
jgi:hypothetical protein